MKSANTEKVKKESKEEEKRKILFWRSTQHQSKVRRNHLSPRKFSLEKISELHPPTTEQKKSKKGEKQTH